MAIYSFAVIGEGNSDDSAFSNAKLTAAGIEYMGGRIRYQILDPSTIYPSDDIAARRVVDIFGVRPQPGQVSPAGVGMNTVYAVRILAAVGKHRLLFFGLRTV